MYSVCSVVVYGMFISSFSLSKFVYVYVFVCLLYSCEVQRLLLLLFFFFFKQKTAYEMRISDWSSDVCSSDLLPGGEPFIVPMAIPLIAGPSGMAAVMLMGSQEPDRMGAWSLALLIAWAATAPILFSATYLYKWLGDRKSVV